MSTISNNNFLPEKSLIIGKPRRIPTRSNFPAGTTRGLTDLTLLIGALVLFVATALGYLRHGFFDDSYISFQYARNLARGGGLVWEYGTKPTEGFTSVGWIVTLGGVARLFNADVPKAAIALGLTFGCVSLAMSWFVLSRLTSARSCLTHCVSFHLAMTPEFVRHALSGMETLLVSTGFLALAIAWLRAQKLQKSKAYWLALGGFSFIATLARPDAAVYALTGSGFLLVRLRRIERIFYYGLGFCVPTALFALTRHAYFEEWLPLPAYMKLRPSVLLEPHLLKFILGHWLGYFSFIALLLALITTASLMIANLNLVASALFAAATAYAVYFLSVLPIMSIHYRFLIPTYPIFAILGGHALLQLLYSGRKARFGTLLVAIFVLAHVGHFPTIKSESASWATAHEVFGNLGRRLRSMRGIRVASSEVGELAWFADTGVIDLAGLNDTFIAKHRFRDENFSQIFASYISSLRPDIYIDPPPEYGYARFANLTSLQSSYETKPFGSLTLHILKESAFASALARLTPAD